MRQFYALHGHWHAKRQGKTMNEIRSAFERPTKKAVIYARFSTDLQNERSIEDQITLCKDYASRANIDVIDVYEDSARSGGSITGAMAYFGSGERRIIRYRRGRGSGSPFA